MHSLCYRGSVKTIKHLIRAAHPESLPTPDFIGRFYASEDANLEGRSEHANARPHARSISAKIQSVSPTKHTFSSTHTRTLGVFRAKA